MKQHYVKNYFFRLKQKVLKIVVHVAEKMKKVQNDAFYSISGAI